MQAESPSRRASMYSSRCVSPTGGRYRGVRAKSRSWGGRESSTDAVSVGGNRRRHEFLRTSGCVAPTCHDVDWQLRVLRSAGAQRARSGTGAALSHHNRHSSRLVRTLRRHLQLGDPTIRVSNRAGGFWALTPSGRRGCRQGPSIAFRPER